MTLKLSLFRALSLIGIVCLVSLLPLFASAQPKDSDPIPPPPGPIPTKPLPPTLPTQEFLDAQKKAIENVEVEPAGPPPTGTGSPLGNTPPNTNMPSPSQSTETDQSSTYLYIGLGIIVLFGAGFLVMRQQQGKG